MFQLWKEFGREIYLLASCTNSIVSLRHSGACLAFSSFSCVKSHLLKLELTHQINYCYRLCWVVRLTDDLSQIQMRSIRPIFFLHIISLKYKCLVGVRNIWRITVPRDIWYSQTRVIWNLFNKLKLKLSWRAERKVLGVEWFINMTTM